MLTAALSLSNTRNCPPSHDALTGVRRRGLLREEEAIIKKYLRSAFVLPVLGTVAVILTLRGWLQQDHSLGDSVFQTIGVLSASGTYGESDKWKGDGWIAAGRWFGLAFFLLTAKKAFGLMLSSQLADLSAQLRRHSVVLIGDHPSFADVAAVVKTRRSVLWIAPEGRSGRRDIRMISRRWSTDLVKRFRLKRSESVVIGYAADDVQALAVAKAFVDRRPQGELLLLSSDLGCQDGLLPSDLVNGVRPISPEAALARSLHQTHPPFRIARDAGQERIHALIFGCGEMGEELLRDLLLSSLVTFLAKPRVTILDPRAHEVIASLKARAPEIELSIEIQGICTVGTSDPRALPIEELTEATAALPFTSAYICLRNDAAAMRAALTLDQASAREGWGLHRIFVRQRSSRAETGAVLSAALGTIIPFGTPEQLAFGLGLMDEGTDDTAKALHDAYRRFAPADATAAISWDDLPENLREANRALLPHLPAKLASIEHDNRGSATGVNLTEALANPEQLERLAEIEHERWMAQRRLNGWRYGPLRDNVRRLHPDLLPYAALSEGAKEKDREMLRTLAGITKAL